jgi:type VI secretion system VasD/TssJ family lipoprotein
MNRLRLLSVIAALAASAGCTSTASLTMRSVAPLNVNEAGESTPVKVRIYCLKNDARFRAATVEALWTGDADVLKDDLLGTRSEAVVRPQGKDDTPVKVSVELPVGTRYIGVLGLYARSDAQDQRTVVLPVAKADGTTLLFTRYAVTVAP